jgi:hypothetical protein
VPGPEWLLWLAGTLPKPGSVLAYVGLGPGQEFIPHFLALLGFIGAALLAIIQWPLLALRRLFARARGAGQHRREGEGRGAADVPETPGKASQEKP